MAVFVGVDGGATRARALVVDQDGHTLARAEGEIALIREADARSVADTASALVRSALAGSGSDSAAALCCALTGVGRETERLAVERAIVKVAPAAHVRVTTDAEAALFDAFGSGAGIVVLSGTGSIAWGRAPDGRTARAGGWGPRLGDEGSAFAIGLAALRAVARGHDLRGRETLLESILVEHLKLAEATGLVGWTDHAARTDIAALAPFVLDAAAFDATAADIVANAANHLASHANAIVRRLGLWSGSVAVALGGGLLAPGRALRERVREAIEQLPFLHVLDADVDGARGAARLAVAMQ